MYKNPSRALCIYLNCSTKFLFSKEIRCYSTNGVVSRNARDIHTVKVRKDLLLIDFGGFLKLFKVLGWTSFGSWESLYPHMASFQASSDRISFINIIVRVVSDYVRMIDVFSGWLSGLFTHKRDGGWLLVLARWYSFLFMCLNSEMIVFVKIYRFNRLFQK